MNYLKGYFHITLGGGKKESIPAFKHEQTCYRLDDGMEIQNAGVFQVEMRDGNPVTVESASQ